MNQLEQQNGVHEPVPRDGEVGEGGDRVDRVLREFFRREMPDPWPTAPAAPLPAPATRSMLAWLRVRSRVALAASVALLLLGYLVLAALFPKAETNSVNPLQGPLIGQKNGVKTSHRLVPIPLQRDKTSSGLEAESRGLIAPDGTVILNVQEVPAKR